MSLTRTADHQPLAAGSYRPSSSSPATGVVLAAGFAQLAMELYGAASMAETVGRVLEYARRATGCDCAGVVVLVQRGKDLQTAGVTDRRVEQADQLQLEYGEGPCVPVSREHHSVLVGDTIVDRRWPRWSQESSLRVEPRADGRAPGHLLDTALVRPSRSRRRGFGVQK